MAIFTSAELTAQMTAWKAALLACAGGQSYNMGGRMLTRADLPEIRTTLEWLDKLMSEASVVSGGGTPGPQLVEGRVRR